MTEQLASANGIEIAYETIGDPSNPPLLLVMGLGMQLIHWDLELCEQLAEQGFHVIRFDNRDAGHSTQIDAPVPDIRRAMLGLRTDAPYLLSDMAGDAVGLLDELGIEGAHVVGASMGGMIAQTMAIEHPERVLSLVSIMSTTGNRRIGLPKLRVWGVLMRQAPRERGGRRRKIGYARSAGLPTSRFPVVDMIDVKESTRSGWLAASIWAIIPPIDAPTTWAFSMPR